MVEKKLPLVAIEMALSRVLYARRRSCESTKFIDAICAGVVLPSVDGDVYALASLDKHEENMVPIDGNILKQNKMKRKQMKQGEGDGSGNKSMAAE